MSSFITVESPPYTLRLRARYSEPVAAAMLRGDGCVALACAGRGAVERFPLEEGFGLIRRYRRGGLLAGVARDRFLCNRMQAEFGIHAALEAADAPVPELLGVCWARRGMGYFGAIATRYVEAPTLLAWLATGPVDAITSLRACGAAIRSVHELGVLHADLNAANILIGARGPLLIDFDRATRHRRLSLRQRAANLLRLRRSLRKAGYSDAVFEGICEGYGGMHLPRDMMWLDELRCWLRGHPRPKDRVSR